MAKRFNRKKEPPRDAPSGELPGSEWIAANGKFLGALLIAAAGFWIYWPAIHGSWIRDDSLYISTNPLMHDPDRIWKAWFQPGSFVEYYPIQETVQWIQWQLWGNDTFGYHLTNIVLHITGALLVWKLFGKFGLRWAWLGGLIFVVHPVQVDSVATVSELKNVLSLPPFLLAMCAYLDYEKNGRRNDYFLSLGWFLVAMLCKVSMALFPFIILLHAWWRRDRIGWKDLKASAPFFVISLVLGLTTALMGGGYFLLHVAPAEPVPLGGLFSRLACAGLSGAFYLSHSLFPVQLLPIYPRWSIDPPSLVQFLPWPIFGAMFCWFWTKRRTWGRPVLLGLGFFFINLLPFLGFNKVSYMGVTWVMDHFLYIPIIGLIGLLIAALGRIGGQLPRSMRPVGMGLIVLALGLLTIESHAYAAVFTSEEALWTYQVDRGVEMEQARINLGNALMDEGRMQEALDQFQEILRTNPGYAKAHYNLGAALGQMGRLQEAKEEFTLALQLRPDRPEAHSNLALVLQQMGDRADAIKEYREAVRLDPNYASAYNSLGGTLLQEKRIPEAIEQFQRALEIQPDYIDAHCNLGTALVYMGRLPEAMEQFETALRLDPANAYARNAIAHVQALQRTVAPKN